MNTKNRPAHPTSTNPTLAELNALIYETYPPNWNRGGWWGYGELYYLGDQLMNIRIIGQPNFIDPHWMLDGMTPGRAECVLGMLERKGIDVARFRLFFEQLEGDRADASRRCEELRASAAIKLSEDERMACGLA
jgi:hypothetical protein